VFLLVPADPGSPRSNKLDLVPKKPDGPVKYWTLGKPVEKQLWT